MAKTLCIFHKACADGLGAAWAVHRALGDRVEFIAANYGDQHELLTPVECAASGKCPSQEDIPRSCVICDGGIGYCKRCHRGEVELDGPCIPVRQIEGRDVLIVDFSYPLATLRAIAAEARSVLVIDHHKTAQEDLAEIGPPSDSRRRITDWGGWLHWISTREKTEACLSAIFDINRSGAGLTWDYLYPGEPRPRIIDLIEDRDLWRFRFGDEARAFHAVLTSYDITDLPIMFRYMDEMVFNKNSDPNKVRAGRIMEGYAILRTNRQAVASAVAASRRTMKIDGYVVPVANVPASMASDAGHLLCQSWSDPKEIVDTFEVEMDNSRLVLHYPLFHYPLFSATYYDGSDGKRHFSLRSPEGGADVGQIAKQMAEKFNHFSYCKAHRHITDKYDFSGTWVGGGHVHAAGFDAPIGWEGRTATTVIATPRRDSARQALHDGDECTCGVFRSE